MKKGNKISRRTFVNNTAAASIAMTMMPSMAMFGSIKPSNKALGLAEQYRSELLDLLQDMIRVQSI